MDRVYHDLIILGGGPAGLTAGIYAKRAGVDVAIIEKGLVGGVVNSSCEVSNYTGFKSVSGMELAQKMQEHAQSFDITFYNDEAKKVYLDGDKKVVECFGKEFECKALIIAIGADVRKLYIEGEKALLGKGVSYCATCDGNFYKDKVVAVIGGGNTALEDSLYLAHLAQKVYIIHRKDDFRGEKYLADRVRARKNIEVIPYSTVSKIFGEERLSKIEVMNIETQQASLLDVDGMFVCIGIDPDTSMLAMDIEKDNAGYIITDKYMQTNLEGVYAVGDIRNTPLKQIITACADGAISATKAYEFLRSH